MIQVCTHAADDRCIFSYSCSFFIMATSKVSCVQRLVHNASMSIVHVVDDVIRKAHVQLVILSSTGQLQFTQ